MRLPNADPPIRLHPDPPAACTKAPRQSNLELLRIVSMLLIIAHHLSIFSGIDYLAPLPALNADGLVFMMYGGKLGVNLFVLISGYFLCTSRFHLKKAVALIVQVTFYSLVIYTLDTLDGNPLPNTTLLQAAFPLLYNGYWFATAYVVMYCLINPLNWMIEQAGKHHLQRLIVFLVIIQSILPTLLDNDLLTSNLTWFLMMYVIGAYLRLYLPEQLNKSFFFITGVGTYCLSVGLGIRILDLAQYQTDAVYYVNYFGRQFSITMLISAVCLFLFFRSLKLGSSRLINAVASTTFGVYLLHCSLVTTPLIWQNLLHVADHVQSPFFLGWALLDILLVFAVCSLLDGLYQFLFARPLTALFYPLIKGLIRLFTWLLHYVSALVIFLSQPHPQFPRIPEVLPLEQDQERMPQ